MSFYEEVDKLGLRDLLVQKQYREPSYFGWQKVFSFLEDIVLNKRRVFIIGDYDVDGLLCNLIWKDTFDNLKIPYSIFKYRERMHTVDTVAIQQCIQGHFEYCIIADTGTNELAKIKTLKKFGIKTIILDHHFTELEYSDYDDSIAIINTIIENKMLNKPIFALSAAALCFTVVDLLFKSLGKETPVGLRAYATVSLFSDVMDMSNELNRSIYWFTMELSKEELPNAIKYFMSEWQTMSARFINYWFSPKINACFRSERFELINKLFLEDNDAVIKSQCIKTITNVHLQSREIVKKVCDIIQVHEMNNFVLANLVSVNKYISVVENLLWNYTGLIANALSKKYSKTAIVLCPVGNLYKGSLRDLFNREYLTTFKQLCYAAGHHAAFGMKINYLDLDNFIIDLMTIDQNYAIQNISNKPIVLNYDALTPDYSLIADIANFNEFSGIKVPSIYLRKKMIGDIREAHSNYYKKYTWGDLIITSNYKIPFGHNMLLKPYKSLGIKLEVQ